MEREKWAVRREKAGRVVCLAFLSLVMTGILFSGRRTWKVTADSRGDRHEGAVTENTATGKPAANTAAKKIAYLTFDDGPSVLTTEYLKILKEEKVCATFFLIGQQLEGELVDVAKQEIQDGHEVGIHTYCHQADKIYASQESCYEDLQKARQCIKEKLGVEPKLFRFPWGSANSYISSYKNAVIEQMQREGIGYTDWNVSGEDSVGSPAADTILANVRRDYGKYDEPVILLHDSSISRETLKALRPLIQELKAQGYSFATLSQKKTPCRFGEYS